MNDISNNQYKELSTGQKRKLHLVLSLIGDPEIIYLDEPTAGLDVESRVILHDEIKKLNKQGKTIIMASHDMAEIENLCDRIAILKEGNIAYVGAIDDSVTQIKPMYEIHLRTSTIIDPINLIDCRYKGSNQGYSIFEVNNIEDGILELMTFIKKENNQVYDIKIEHPSLEKRFMEMAKEDQV